MTTALIEQPEQQTILITVTEQTIQETIDGMMSLKIDGIEDTKNRELVSVARKQVVKLRTTADKERVAVKEQALEECRRIDKQWKELFALIEPVEAHLKAEEKRIADAEAVIEREKLNKLIDARMESLERVGVGPHSVNTAQVGAMSDDQFTEFRMRLAQQVATQRETEKKLAAERAELEKTRIEAERVRKEQQADIERQQRELAEQRESLAKKQREIEAAELAKKQAEAAQQLERDRLAKIELLKPDHEKLTSVINQLIAVQVPNVGPDAEYAKSQIEAALSLAYATIGLILHGMVK